MRVTDGKNCTKTNLHSVQCNKISIKKFAFRYFFFVVGHKNKNKDYVKGKKFATRCMVCSVTGRTILLHFIKSIC